MKCHETNWFQVNQLKITTHLVSKVIAGDGSNLEYQSLGGKIRETKGSKKQRVSMVANNTVLYTVNP